jgi:methionyl aminopeptidase
MSANNRSLAKSLEEIKKIEISSRILADVLSLLEKYVKPGVETLELDKIAEDYIRSKDAIPAFKGFPGEFSPFPGTLCISIDEQVVHGIPSNRKLEEGQIVTLDGGVLKDSYYADSAVTYGVGVISDEKKQLMKITEESLYLGIA